MTVRATAEDVDALYRSEMAPAEFDRLLAEALCDEDENANLDALIEWFTKRYPTVEARFRYLRRHRRR